MEKFNTITKQIRKSYKVCDECGEHINEYGKDWFELKSIVGQWKDSCAESITYHFCTYGCLGNFIKNHSPSDTISCELQERR